MIIVYMPYDRLVDILPQHNYKSGGKTVALYVCATYITAIHSIRICVYESAFEKSVQRRSNNSLFLLIGIDPLINEKPPTTKFHID